MTETPPPDDDNVNRDGLRTLAGMRRDSDDRLVAGVCSGAARHLNVDPIIIRIGFVALTFIGLAGLILYLAAWFLIPADDEDQSIAADWFNLDRNEEQVRTIGLFAALVLAVAAIVGDRGWGLWWIGWWVVPAAFLFWLFAVRPRRRREETLAGWSTDPDVVKTQVDAYTAAKTAQILERKRARLERRQESRALRGLTFSIILIAEAVTLIVDHTVIPVPAQAYLAVALAGVAVGCLVGTVWGNAGGLIAVGLLLTAALTISSLVPHGPMGRSEFAPTTAHAVKAHYRHGVGEMAIDLSGVAHPAQLTGRTINVDAGVGRTVVYVPDSLPVRLDVRLGAGEIYAFGEQWHGRDNNPTIKDGDGPGLHVVVHQKVGDVEVIRK
ncbi:MAG: PspC domain-containing protein [Aeromicrobium sp.]